MMAPMAASLIAAMTSSLIRTVASSLTNSISVKGVMRVRKRTRKWFSRRLALPLIIEAMSGKEQEEDIIPWIKWIKIFSSAPSLKIYY